jgi:hypothetical protein
MTQPEFTFRPGVTGDDVDRLTAHLCFARGWQTRQQIGDALGWNERKIRDVAESMGSKIVRGQKGFHLTASVPREELGLVVQAADAFISQGKRMIRYGIALKNWLHKQIA